MLCTLLIPADRDQAKSRQPMKKAILRHSLSFVAGVVVTATTAYLFSSRLHTPGLHPAQKPSGETPAPTPRLQAPAARLKLDPEASLDPALRLAGGLRRDRAFLDFLEGLDAGNWQKAWTHYATAIKGKETIHETRTRQLLNRVGELAGQTAVAWFRQTGHRDQAQPVLAGWAAMDPKPAAAFVMAGPDTGDLYAPLIQGTGQHSIGSLLEIAEAIPGAESYNLDKEFIAAARQQGSPADGEQLWRKLRSKWIKEEESSAGATSPNDSVGSEALFENLTTWQVEEATAKGTPIAARDWLSGIIAEGFRMREDTLGGVGHAAAEADPEGTLLWASETASKFQSDPEQQKRVTRQQGYEAAKLWAKKDPLALSQWLTAHPGHLAYDTGAAALYLALKDSDPAAAAAWSAEIKDVSLRQWTRLDPVPPHPGRQ